MTYAGSRRIIDVDSHLIELEDFLFLTANDDEKAVMQKRDRLELGREQFRAWQGNPQLTAEYETQILDKSKVGWGRIGDPIGKFEESMSNCDQVTMDAFYFNNMAEIMHLSPA